MDPFSPFSPCPSPRGWPLLGAWRWGGAGHPPGSALTQGLAGHAHKGSLSPVAATATLEAEEAPEAVLARCSALR